MFKYSHSNVSFNVNWLNSIRTVRCHIFFCIIEFLIHPLPPLFISIKTSALLVWFFMADRERAAAKTQLIQDPLFLISSLLLIGRGRVDLIIRGRCLRTGGEVWSRTKEGVGGKNDTFSHYPALALCCLKKLKFSSSSQWADMKSTHMKPSAPPSPTILHLVNVLARAQTKGGIHHYSKFFFPNLSHPPPARITARV